MSPLRTPRRINRILYTRKFTLQASMMRLARLREDKTKTGLRDKTASSRRCIHAIESASVQSVRLRRPPTCASAGPCKISGYRSIICLEHPCTLPERIIVRFGKRKRQTRVLYIHVTIEFIKGNLARHKADKQKRNRERQRAQYDGKQRRSDGASNMRPHRKILQSTENATRHQRYTSRQRALLVPVNIFINYLGRC